ncbi:hypothetical protein SRHO_G00221800 [Serrasalmus rhombeus]
MTLSLSLSRARPANCNKLKNENTNKVDELPSRARTASTLRRRCSREEQQTLLIRLARKTKGERKADATTTPTCGLLQIPQRRETRGNNVRNPACRRSKPESPHISSTLMQFNPGGHQVAPRSKRRIKEQQILIWSYTLAQQPETLHDEQNSRIPHMLYRAKRTRCFTIIPPSSERPRLSDQRTSTLLSAAPRARSRGLFS